MNNWGSNADIVVGTGPVQVTIIYCDAWGTSSEEAFDVLNLIEKTFGKERFTFTIQVDESLSGKFDVLVDNQMVYDKSANEMMSPLEN